MPANYPCVVVVVLRYCMYAFPLLLCVTPFQIIITVPFCAVRSHRYCHFVGANVRYLPVTIAIHCVPYCYPAATCGIYTYHPLPSAFCVFNFML